MIIITTTIIIIALMAVKIGLHGKRFRVRWTRHAQHTFAYYYYVRSVCPRETCWQIGGPSSISIIETIPYTDHDRRVDRTCTQSDCVCVCVCICASEWWKRVLKKKKKLARKKIGDVGGKWERKSWREFVNGCDVILAPQDSVL